MSVYSLEMDVEVCNGVRIIDAEWLKEPVEGSSFEEAYEKALRSRKNAQFK